MSDHTSGTINEDGSPVLIEAVYYRHFAVYRWDCDSVDEARGFLVAGEEDGSLSSVGVFVEGEPVLTDVWLNPHPPDDKENAKMLEDYAKARS